jgi:hypothetical protein
MRGAHEGLPVHTELIALVATREADYEQLSAAAIRCVFAPWIGNYTHRATDYWMLGRPNGDG